MRGKADARHSLQVVMGEGYPFGEIEKKWQDYWERNRTFKVSEDESVPESKRLYVLDMFPYPSGDGLHVGHPEGYTATDIYVRFKRMQGYNVLHPMGFDAFGLPAENYALATGQHPRITTEKNINNFRKQIKSLGFSYDWDREVITSSPDYYKWTQRIFLKLYEKGLAYESNMPINWCSSCKTGLANEEVKDGKCERCGSIVTRRSIRQWVLKITEYAERLLEDLDLLDWPESVKAMQRNWIGKSIGVNMAFKVDGSDDVITVFTTRADTVFGVSCLVISPEYSDIGRFICPEQKDACLKYIESASKKSEMDRTSDKTEKTGVFTGTYVINPVSGKKVPLWIADYVLSTYATGAVMSVPAHDQRDFDFSKKYGLPIICVIDNGEGPDAVLSEAYTGDGKHINSGFLDGLDTPTAIAKVMEYVESKGIGEKRVNYKLRDWIFSRQRYWGEPIPLIHCPKCGTVEETELPLLLPETTNYKPTEEGESPLAHVDSFINVKCPKCGCDARRETNTMPQWAGSCWYYLRYLDPHNDKEFVSPAAEKYWMPVDLYVGGAEHAVLHLLYARFIHKVLFDLGMVSTKEPFQRLVNQGLITAFSYQRPNKTLVRSDLVEERDGRYFEKDAGTELTKVIAKMSKSLKNVVNPDDVIREHGADCLRMYEMFLGPLQASKPWSTSGITGLDRFLQRAYKLKDKVAEDVSLSPEDEKIMNSTIRKVTEDTDALSFNTAISSMMVYAGHMAQMDKVPAVMFRSLVLILAPYAPHLAEELYEFLGGKESVSKASWPSFDESKIVEDNVSIAVQVNGKVRSVVEVAMDSDDDRVVSLAKNDGKIAKWLEGKSIVKTIVVKNRIVNFIIK